MEGGRQGGKIEEIRQEGMGEDQGGGREAGGKKIEEIRQEWMGEDQGGGREQGGKIEEIRQEGIGEGSQYKLYVALRSCNTL